MNPGEHNSMALQPSEQPFAGPSSDGFSSKGTFMACPQKYAFWRLLGLTPTREPKARARGSLLHTATMWRHLQLMGSPWARGVDPVEMMRRMPRRYAHVFAESERLYRDYCDHWGDDLGLKLLSVEREHALTFDSGRVRHSQRLDFVAEEQGRAVIYDTKTHYSSVNHCVEEWSRSPQFALLTVIGEVLVPQPPPIGYGLPFGGLKINYIKSAADADGMRFARPSVTVPRHFIGLVVQAMVDAARERDTLAESGRDAWSYPRRPNACLDRFGWCDFIELCLYGQAALSRMAFEVDEDIKRASRT